MISGSSQSTRIIVFRVLIFISFVTLLLRYGYVQLIQQDVYFKQSERNRIRPITLVPPRGIVRDRYEEILVDNVPAYSVYAIPNELSAPDSVFDLLGDLLNRDPESFRQIFKRDRRGLFQEVKICRYIDFASLIRIEENKLDLPGIVYGIEPRRFYPAGVKAPHLFGYLGEIDEKGLQSEEFASYKLGDVIGKAGIERIYEKTLQGKKGFQIVEVDALGREVSVLDQLQSQPPVPGLELHLSIDAGLQRYLEQKMDTLRGGVAVLNCQNGEVIALVSKPGYNPELFAKPISEKAWKELTSDPAKPLYDRMVQSGTNPGSTYKIITAIAGLQEGLINPDEKVYCPGVYRLGRRSFKCHKEEGHGSVNLQQAIEQSCNVYFYRMIQKVGLENWAKYSKMFHFGEKTGIDLTQEYSGSIPDKDYFDHRYGEKKWSKGLLLNLTVGQGELLVTPLQMASFALLIANRGQGFRPHVNRFIKNPETGDEFFFERKELLVEGIREDVWDLVHAGMFDVVNGIHGTAKRANPWRIKVAGKTGTAQNPHGDDHAWFIGFAPFKNPRVAFCFFVENGGGGGAVAAPIAGSMLRYLLREKKI
ncbi:MAG: penicillin-binding protein 2 [Calditrichaeota bacterium]|nr:MAG: penicillin-binding protein 2 [Calditrichota bacterium]